MHNYREAETRLMSSLRERTLEDAQSASTPWRENARDAGSPRYLGYYIPTGNRKLDSILAGARPPIQYGGTNSGVVVAGMRNGEYVPQGSSWIVQPAPELFYSEDDRRATLAHELVHWTKELGRSPRPLHGAPVNFEGLDAPPPGYAEEELVAEIGAALLLDAIGADPQWDKRAAYMLNWSLAFDGDTSAVTAAYRNALVEAELAVDYLLQFAEGVD